MGGLQAMDSGDSLYFESFARFVGGASFVPVLFASAPSIDGAASSLLTESSSLERFDSNRPSGGGKLKPWLAKCKSPLLPLEHFIKSKDAEDPGLKCPTELLAPTELVGPTEWFELIELLSLLLFPVINGSCADATLERESKDAILDGVGIDARFLSAAS